MDGLDGDTPGAESDAASAPADPLSDPLAEEDTPRSVSVASAAEGDGGAGGRGDGGDDETRGADARASSTASVDSVRSEGGASDEGETKGIDVDAVVMEGGRDTR